MNARKFMISFKLPSIVFREKKKSFDLISERFKETSAIYLIDLYDLFHIYITIIYKPFYFILIEKRSF